MLAQREEQQASDAATEVIDLEAPAISVSAVGTSSASGTASTVAGGSSPDHRALESAAARTPQPPVHLSPRHPGLLPPQSPKVGSPPMNRTPPLPQAQWRRRRRTGQLVDSWQLACSAHASAHLARQVADSLNSAP